MKYVLYSSDYVTKILEKKGFNFEYRITVDSNEINNDVKSVYYLKNNYNGEKIIIPSFISDDINSDDIYNYMISIGFDRNNILFIPIEMIYGDEAIDVDKFYKYDDVTYLDYIEININDHCNLNCKGCSHFAPLAPASFKNFNTFLKDIKRLKQLIPHIFKIRIMGGEPFLNPELKRYVETLKEVCQTVHPRIGVIPIHKDENSRYDSISGISSYFIFDEGDVDIHDIHISVK